MATVNFNISASRDVSIKEIVTLVTLGSIRSREAGKKNITKMYKEKKIKRVSSPSLTTQKRLFRLSKQRDQTRLLQDESCTLEVQRLPPP